MRLVIAAEVAGVNAVAGPIVAAAVVYDVKVPEPAFAYTDVRGTPRSARIADVPIHLQAQVTDYIKRRALSWATAIARATEVSEKGGRVAALDAMGFAVARAVERALHQRTSDLEGIERHEIVIHVNGADRLPENLVPGIHHSLRSEDWRLSAASLLAKRTHLEAMDRLSELYPAFGFDKNQGRLTNDHKAALIRRGPCPEHRTASNVVRLAARRKK